MTDAVPLGGETFDLGEASFFTGLGVPDTPIRQMILDFSAAPGEVLAGVPTATISVEQPTGSDPVTGEPIFFVALGRILSPGIFRRVDN